MKHRIVNYIYWACIETIVNKDFFRNNVSKNFLKSLENLVCLSDNINVKKIPGVETS